MRSILLALALLPSLALAQNVDTTATSGSSSGATTNTRVDNALTLNTEQLPETTVRAAPGIGLAATTNSFSSDYCGGTAQIGGSGIGFSVGVSKQVQDARCNARRDVQSFGQLAAQYHNFGQAQQRDAAQAMAAFVLCTSDSRYVDACKRAGLVVAK
ncbi:MAG TPA: hypothetical protein VFE72_02995 [Lysobacter sp.]|nr:hypothetical protein [Lysobacter sp.]